MPAAPKIAIVVHSGYGHTALIAEHVARGAAEAGASVEIIPVDAVEGRWEELAAADAIVFGTPTYMGTVSGPFKMFMDASSKPWFVRAWQDKIAAGFTHSGSWSGDKLNTLHTLQTFAMQHGMIWVGSDLLPGFNTTAGSIEDLNRVGSFSGLMTQSPVDAGADAIPPSDLRTAERFGARVATVAATWLAGRETTSLGAKVPVLG